MDNIKWTIKKEYLNHKRRTMGLIIVKFVRNLGIGIRIFVLKNQLIAYER